MTDETYREQFFGDVMDELRRAVGVRAVYLAMGLTTWYVIVPLALAALLSGVIQSLGTPWGLFHHYWLVAKLLITLVGTLVLLLHTQVVDQLVHVSVHRHLDRTTDVDANTHFAASSAV